MLAVQWTESTLLLLPAGVASVLRQLRRGAKEKGAILILYSLWFFACRWNLLDPDFYPTYGTILEVGRGKAVFALVKARE